MASIVLCSKPNMLCILYYYFALLYFFFFFIYIIFAVVGVLAPVPILVPSIQLIVIVIVISPKLKASSVIISNTY